MINRGAAFARPPCDAGTMGMRAFHTCWTALVCALCVLTALVCAAHAGPYEDALAHFTTDSFADTTDGINGVAVGAGLGLAMATDVRLVAKSARLMAGYTRIGGSPDAGLTITLPQAMGYERAMRFMMENRTASGTEAVEWGMAGDVVDDAQFTERLAAYCQELCAWSPITLRLLKRGMVKSLESTDMEQQLRYEVGNIRIAFASDDAKEARKAFFEKRKPVFVGK